MAAYQWISHSQGAYELLSQCSGGLTSLWSLSYISTVLPFTVCSLCREMGSAMPEGLEVAVFVGLLCCILRYSRGLVLASITELRGYAIKNSSRDSTWDDCAALNKSLSTVLQYGKTAVLVFEGGVSLVINFGQGAYITTATASELEDDVLRCADEGQQCVCAMHFQGYDRLVVIKGCNASFSAQVGLGCAYK